MFFDMVVLDMKWTAFLRMCHILREHANVPNTLTVVRGLAVPVIIAIMLLASIANALTFWILLVAFACDGLDGLVARLLKKVTPEGAALYRTADKIDFFSSLPLIAVVLYMLLNGASIGMIILMVFLIIHLAILESMLVAIGWWGYKRGLSVESTIWGKTKMFLEYSLMVWILVLFHRYQSYLQPWIDFPLNRENCLKITLALLVASNIFAVCSLRGYWIKYAPTLGPFLSPLLLRLQFSLNQFLFCFFVSIG